MALEEYRRKRDFQKTPEPAPNGPFDSRTDRLSYFIQKHDATRLHYDFRLELDGVLLSWAVTKGPSLNPADKRLAVRTEDHPLSYGSFEGTIPKGEYGGGTVMLWDTGAWEPIEDPHKGLKKGHLSFILHGTRLKGRWDLVRMRNDKKNENWLLIKKDDSAARKDGNGEFLDESAFSVTTGRTMGEIARGQKSKSQRSGQSLSALIKMYSEVQLATLVEEPPPGESWLHEIKFDGYRLLGFISSGVPCLRTRNGKDWTDRFPTLSSALKKLNVKNAVVDMEAVVLDADGKSSFQALQAALGNGGDAQSIVAFVFDLIYLDGQSLANEPLTQRKEKLQHLLEESAQNKALRYSAHVLGQGAEVFAKACKSGVEGIISKRATAPYVAGRQKGWLKTKCIRRQEFIILGFSNAHSGGRALGALYLGYPKDGTMFYAGKVGTGFSMVSAEEIRNRLVRLAVDKPALARVEMTDVAAGEWREIHWAKPKLLCEVSFTEWTGDGRIRHPSFQGLREDKNAAEVIREEPVEIAKIKDSPAPKAASTKLIVGGIAITHPDRVISETGHVTKGELAEYYAAASAFILPHIIRRPLSLLRCPSGIDSECFFQRNPGKGLGTDVRPFEFKHKGKKYDYLYVEDEKGLLEVIQMGTIELHPWGATVDSIEYPDRMIFDLDPAPEVPFDAVKLAAQDIRERLKRRGLDSVLKCTGGKGLHVIVPLAAKDKWPEVKLFAGSLAKEMVSAAPEAYVATMSKEKRIGKIFIDYFRNDYTATAIADYGVRARPGAPVACLLDWRELAKLQSASQFTMKDTLKRIQGKTPGWPVAQPLPKD